MRPPRIAYLLVALAAAASLAPDGADAGCGCDKRPPDRAVVRPRFAPGRKPIILFHPSLVRGREYDVVFIRRLPSGRPLEKSVKGTARLWRDQADFPFDELNVPQERRTPIAPKVQIRVAVPPTGGPGPRAIRVVDRLTREVKIELPESAFLQIGDPIQVKPSAVWERSYTTAVDADGYLYIALDFEGVLDPTIMEGLAAGEPNRRLLPEHVVGYNGQGYMFSTLDALPKDSSLFKWEIVPSDGRHSDMLRYWRHSFRDWAAEHDEHRLGPKRREPSDSYYWHVDGTPHVDHNLWVVAIKEDFLKARRPPKRGSSRRVIVVKLQTRPGGDLK